MAGDIHTDRAKQRVQAAIRAFQAGDPVCLHDFEDREGETDLVYPARAVTPEDVAQLRNDAGGLICVAVSDAVATAADLPYLADVIDHPAVERDTLAYGDRSSFSFPVNHRDTFTGITDTDRARTITELGNYAAATEAEESSEPTFSERFRIPGHVPLLRAAPGLLADRRGHTELGIALAEAAGLPPAVVVCEMLADGDGAQSVETVKAYARREGLPFLTGPDVVDILR